MDKKCQKEIYCINRQSYFLKKKGNEKKRRREVQRIDLIILN